MKEVQRERLAVRLKDFILGAQDGIVSSLGLALGVAFATLNSRIVIISGLAGALAEFISMTAVAYTSTEAAEHYYKTEKHRKLKMPKEYKSPFESGLIVGLSNIIGSLVAIVPFFFFGLNEAIKNSVIVSAVVLFLIGVIEAKLTVGNWIKSGLKLTLIGLVAAFAGYLIGRVLGVLV